MKNLFKRMSAGLLALMIVISLLPASVSAAKISTPATGYTKASDVNYVKNGNYVLNWGARNETCVFLSTYAQNFYTGSYTFEQMSTLSGGSSQGNAPQSALYSSLKSLMTSKHTHKTSYGETKNQYRYTDCVSNNSSKISSFYSGTTLNGNWGSSPSWNREHTWPNSKGLGGSDEDDIMMLRPTATSENSSRGNTAYGESSGYFDPGESTRGDVARIVLYVYVRWGNTNYMWGKSGVMENMNVLLKWMKEDPVDTWEMGRNDAVQSITGTRNVFVDYPEYAWLLFGQDVPSGITTPSDNDGVTANPGGNTGSGNTGSGSNTSSNYTQVSSLKDGDKVVIVNPGSKMALSATKIGYYNVGIDVSNGFGDITDAEIYTAKKNSDGTWSFTSGTGKKLALAADFNSLNETGTNDKWELSSAGTNQFYMKNTGRGVYLDWFADKGNWSTYTLSTTDPNFVLAFYTKTATSDSTGGNTNTGNNNTGNSGTGGNTGSTGNTGNSGNTTTTKPPATQPPATQAPATQPPATQPPATQPGTSVGTQTSTPVTQPNQPAPLPVASVNPDDFIQKDEDNGGNTIVVILAIVAGVAVVAAVVIYFVVFKPKKNVTAVAEETPAEETDDKTPTEENE